MSDGDARLVLGYIRVSTIEQESGWGREAQEERIKAYSAEKGLGSPELIYESKSGESIIARQELHTMMARAEQAVEAGIEAHVILPGLDRLTRDLIDQEALTTRCFRTGVRLHSTLGSENDTLDPSFAGDPMRTAIRQFFGIINQLDRAVIQRRLDGGLAKKGAQGGFTGGRTPFGYVSVNKELQVDEAAAAAVRRIFAMEAAGLDQTAIAAVVAREHPEICGHWKKQQISRVLERRDLYLHGQYRPRGAAAAVVRPDLVIVAGDEELGTVAFDWEKMPDPVSMTALAALWGVSEQHVREIALKAKVLVRWRRNNAYIPRADARRMEQAVKTLN